MAEFIGRPNIPYGAFRREDVPSTGQTLIDTISRVLGDYSARKAQEQANSIPTSQAIAAGLVPRNVGRNTVTLPDGRSITIGQADPAEQVYGPRIGPPLLKFLQDKVLAQSALEKALSVQGLRTEAVKTGQAAKQEADILNPQEQSVLEELSGAPKGRFAGVRKGAIPVAQLVPKELSSENNKLKNNAEAGLSEISTIRNIFSKTGRATVAKASAGGLTGKLVRLGDKEAIKLKDASANLSDVISRLRTGAAINATEERVYKEAILDWSRDPENNADALNRVQQFLSGVKDDIEAGKRKFGAAKSEPAKSSGSTATNDDPLGVLK